MTHLKNYYYSIISLHCGCVQASNVEFLHFRFYNRAPYCPPQKLFTVIYETISNHLFLVPMSVVLPNFIQIISHANIRTTNNDIGGIAKLLHAYSNFKRL